MSDPSFGAQNYSLSVHQKRTTAGGHMETFSANDILQNIQNMANVDPYFNTKNVKSLASEHLPPTAVTRWGLRPLDFRCRFALAIDRYFSMPSTVYGFVDSLTFSRSLYEYFFLLFSYLSVCLCFRLSVLCCVVLCQLK